MNTKFISSDPTIETCWRSIILLGNNVASYKFALAKALLGIDKKDTFISLEELALPFSESLTEHLQTAEKQITSSSSKFLDFCSQYNRGAIDKDQLIQQTVKLGFVNVIDAFHNVARSEVPYRFFEDARKGREGIVLTDEFYKLLNSRQAGNFIYEAESRWRLWETAISLNVSPNLLTVNNDTSSDTLFVLKPDSRRIDVTSSRDALNGYQKGKCFYCSRAISIEQGKENSCDVDHFLPHSLKSYGFSEIDGIWNLVLACKECNRGTEGKSNKVPELSYLYALNNRNNYYIESHHPLKETIKNQTGKTREEREHFLQTQYNRAIETIPIRWGRGGLDLEDCVFCNVEKGRIVYEDDLFFVIRDGFPVSELHTLIIPKKHVASFFELGEPENTALTRLLKNQRQTLQGYDSAITGFNVGVNDGVSAGQTVMHCHIHLIPRRDGDTSDPRGGVRGVIPDKQKY